MIHFEFTPKSLLYGESIFWLFSNMFAPYFWVPDFTQTQSHHVLLDYSKASAWIGRYSRLARTNFMQKQWLRLIVVSQVSYLLIAVMNGIAIQEELFQTYKLDQDESLSYKYLYYMPTMYRAGLLMITINTLRKSYYTTWHTYDQAPYFAVGETSQKRLMTTSIMSILPATLFFLDETFFYFIYAERFEFLNNLHLAMGVYFTVLRVIGIMALAGACLVNVQMRYKPAINIIYLSSAIRRHLMCLNDTIDKQDRCRAARGGRSRHIRSTLALQQHTKLLEAPKHAKIFIAPNTTIGAQCVTKHQETMAINNLYQLERHLTQVQLLVSKIDCDYPATVLAITLVSIILIFYGLLFALKTGLPDTQLSLLFVVNIAGNSIPIITLFISGHRLGLESRRLARRLESLYLEKQTHRLLYKQMSNIQHSLSRTFKTIESIKFDCNGLMGINLGTLAACGAYIVAGLFLVIQYDSLVGMS